MNWVLESRMLAPAMLPFAAAVLLHIVLWRAWRRASLATVLGGPLVAGALLCAVWLWLWGGSAGQPGRLGDAIAALTVYLSLTYAYIELYSLNRTSIRLQALRFVCSNGGSARQEDLDRACGHATTVEHRLAQYVQMGDLVLVDGKYRMARRRILLVTRFFHLLRRMMLGSRPLGM